MAFRQDLWLVRCVMLFSCLLDFILSACGCNCYERPEQRLSQRKSIQCPNRASLLYKNENTQQHYRLRQRLSRLRDEEGDGKSI